MMNLKLRIKKIKKGDNVQVLLGKDRGKKGKVEKVLNKKGKVFVAGVNLYKRHVKKHGQTEGGVIELLKPLNVSNVAVICPSCTKATRIGFKFEGDEKIRVCKKCGKVVK